MTDPSEQECPEGSFNSDLYTPAMTKILAIDTSHAICSVALNISEKITSRVSAAPRQHARQLLPMIEALLAEQGLRARDLDAIALVIGPGSFTGLRIGAGVAQGLSFATGVPVLCISSLAVMAMQAHLEQHCDLVSVCLLAREDEVYAASYQIVGEDPILIGNEQVCEPSLAIFTPDGFAAGDGWTLLPAARGSHATMHECRSDAKTLSMIAVQHCRKGLGVSAPMVLPVYLKEQMDYQT